MQYQHTLDNNGYKHITQIAEDGKHTGGVGEVADLCSMPVGITRLLIKYVITDTERITKKESESHQNQCSSV
jgi:hypothetical protein